ncbi:MAG: hypothetical protein H6718_23570 [Polyangiaceae bacterium]|nr:hypothetical protein [Polyangiaceae bacterium]
MKSARPPLFTCLGALALLVGCSSKDKPQATAFGGNGGAGAEGGSVQGGSTQGGSASRGGSANAGSSSGGSGNSGSGGIHTGTAGDASGGAAVGGSGGELVPTDTACEEQRAFLAGGMAFVSPTPPELGLALSRLLYDPASKPISVVARFKPSEAIGDAWIGATELDGFNQTFPQGFVPEPVDLALQFGGFNTTEPAKEAWLALGENTRIRLENVELVAKTSNACSVLDATLSAVIPDSEGAVELDLPSGKTTVGTLAGGTTTTWNVRAVFQAATTDFDFEALP